MVIIISNIEAIKDLQDLVGKKIDFFLEDDMFELEGVVRKEDNKIVVEITGAIQHIFKMIGNILEIKLDKQKMYLHKLNTKEKYEININRIYKSMNNPTKEEISALVDKGIYEFFKKSEDTIVSHIDSTNIWSIKFFRDDLASGIIKSYETLEELYDDNSNIMNGKWDAIYYNCEWE